MSENQDWDQHPFGKNKVWNRAGTKPDLADSLSAAAQAVKPEAGSGEGTPSYLCTSIGLCWVSPWDSRNSWSRSQPPKRGGTCPACLRRSHTSLTFKLVGCSWYSVPPRGQIIGSRTVPPEVTEGFARRHDHEAVQCMCRLLQVEQTLCPSVLDTARIGGLGVGETSSHDERRLCLIGAL